MEKKSKVGHWVRKERKTKVSDVLIFPVQPISFLISFFFSLFISSICQESLLDKHSNDLNNKS